MREKFPCGNSISEYTAQALSCAAISDLTAFRIPLAEQSWCILVRYNIYVYFYKILAFLNVHPLACTILCIVIFYVNNHLQNFKVQYHCSISLNFSI